MDGIRIPVQRDDVDPAWHLYPVRILDGRRKRGLRQLREAGIGVQVNYMPGALAPGLRRPGLPARHVPDRGAFYREEISLPLFPDLTDADVDRVIETLTGLVG